MAAMPATTCKIDRDYKAVAERTIVDLENRGVDMIIGVTHLLMWKDVELAGLKADHPKLAFIVGGHDHEPQYSPASDTTAVVMKGASNARVIWQIDVEFDAPRAATSSMRNASIWTSRYRLIRNTRSWPTSGALGYLGKFPFLNARVGTAAFAMDVREETVRSTETSWGNFITDQMRTAFGEPKADLRVHQLGDLCASMTTSKMTSCSMISGERLALVPSCATRH